jgi:hypothetical protein
VPINLAATHQAGSLTLLSTSLWVLFTLHRGPLVVVASAAAPRASAAMGLLLACAALPSEDVDGRDDGEQEEESEEEMKEGEQEGQKQVALYKDVAEKSA